jgi:site-specific recombinase XerC
VPDPHRDAADQMCALLADCSGRDLVPRRDTATILLFADSGIRLSDLANLTVDNLDLESGCSRRRVGRFASMPRWPPR